MIKLFKLRFLWCHQLPCACNYLPLAIRAICSLWSGKLYVRTRRRFQFNFRKLYYYYFIIIFLFFRLVIAYRQNGNNKFTVFSPYTRLLLNNLKSSSEGNIACSCTLCVQGLWKKNEPGVGTHPINRSGMRKTSHEQYIDAESLIYLYRVGLVVIDKSDNLIIQYRRRPICWCCRWARKDDKRRGDLLFPPPLPSPTPMLQQLRIHAAGGRLREELKTV